MVEAVIAFGGGCGRTISPLPTCPLHPRWPFFSLTHSSLVSFTLSSRDLVCWVLMHRLWAILVSCRHFLGLHELLKHPRTVIRVLAAVLFIHGQNRSCFLLTQGLYCCASSRKGIPSHFPSSRMVFCWIYPRSISLGEL